MKYTLTVIAAIAVITLPSLASAQVKPTFVGHGHSDPGVIHTLNGDNTPRVESPNNKWVVDGFDLFSVGTGDPVIHFNNYGQVSHNGIDVSWSPDSKRFVILDRDGRGFRWSPAKLIARDCGGKSH